MLEVEMDKKLICVGRQGSESRGVKQDVSPNAKFPRGGSGGRRREGSVPKTDQPPKSWPQKQGAFDKRFQSRAYGDRNGSRVECNVDAEVGSAFRPGSKKLNMSHLLNFNYGHREDGRMSSGSWGGAGQGNRNRNMWTTRRHKYNKELFLQANCQFVVQEGHDYMVYSVDPDLLVDWNWIEQVHVYSHETPSCPICLYPPVAAKMTRCGHIYCWPCMLHYLALSDKSWRKCPICYEAVHKADLKSLTAFATRCFNVGEDITMKLMYRDRDSVIALPRGVPGRKGGVAGAVGQPFLLSDQANVHYAKLLLASREEVLEGILNREERELMVALDHSSHCPEVCFVEAAIELLANRRALLLGEERGKELELQSGDAKLAVEVADEALECESNAAEPRKVADDDEVSVNVDVACALEELTVSDELLQPSDKESPIKNGFYFYQASDGQHVYLHTLNVHMLTNEYGSLDRCPDIITARIVEKEDISMNTDLRRRLRCLGHLPLTCEFQVVELRLSEPLLSKKTIDDYEEEVDKRRRRRSRRAREDNKRERKFHAEENRRMGRGGPINQFHLEKNLQQFPEWSSSAEGGAVVSGDHVDGDDTLSLSPVGSTKSAASGTFGSPDGWGNNGCSFAEMLRTGKVQPEFVDRRKTDTAPSENVRRARGRYDSDSDSEEAAHAPNYHDSFSAAFQLAFDKSAALASATDGGEQSRAGGNRKKKGKQKRLLFTTGVIRNK